MIRQQKTDYSLTFKMIPISGWIVGTITIIAAFLIGYLFGDQATLSCKRSPEIGTCILTSYNPILFKHKVITTFDVANLLSANVDSSNSAHGSTYRVILETAKENIPLTDYYSYGYAKHRDITQEIQTFVNNKSSQYLEVNSGSFYLVILMFLVFFGSGFTMLMFSKVLSLTCDKNKQKIIFITWGMFGKRIREYNLSDLVSVKLEIEEEKNSTCCRDVLLFSSGEKTPLTTYYFCGTQDCLDLKTLAITINDFIGSDNKPNNHPPII